MVYVRAKMAALILCLAAVVAGCLLSTFRVSRRVGPAREIEEIWALEDERQESELRTEIYYQGNPLPYDEETRTYYLSLDGSRSWPELDLKLPEGSPVQAFFSDDYTQDACEDAVRDGIAYEMFLYDRESYSYASMIFTTLPVIQLTRREKIEEEIGREDVACDILWSDASGGLACYGRIHRRGASTLLTNTPKHGYRLEFTRTESGKKKIYQDVPGFGQKNAIVLLPMAGDDTLMRDRLCWEAYNEMAGERPFGARQVEYVEMVLNGHYHGVYLALEPFQAVQELERAGDMHLLTDGVYRTAALNFSRGRLVQRHPFRSNAGYELYYTPTQSLPFQQLGTYLDILKEKSDTAFLEKAKRHIDLDSMLDHILLVQALGMTDNVFNNMYIWADLSSGSAIYRFVPWDMDETWGHMKVDVGEEYENWLWFPLADRLLMLDAGLREELVSRWDASRTDGVFSDEHLLALVEQGASELNDSGAMIRNAERWSTNQGQVDDESLIAFLTLRLPVVDEAMDMLRNGETEFLSRTEYERKGGPLYPPEETEEDEY